jgi:hypothetical protein
LTVDNCLIANLDAYEYGNYRRTGNAYPTYGYNQAAQLWQNCFPHTTVKNCTFWVSTRTDAPEGGAGLEFSLVSTTFEWVGEDHPRVGYVFQDNIVYCSTNGAHYDGGHNQWTYLLCSDTLDGTPDWSCHHNIFAGGTGAATPTVGQFPATDNYFPTRAAVQAAFVDHASMDLTLSPGHGLGTSSTGGDPGCNMTTLTAALANCR